MLKFLQRDGLSKHPIFHLQFFLLRLNQKYFVNRLFRLEKKDLRFNYTEQSIKFLSKLGISHKFDENFLILDENDKQNFNKDFVNLPKPWVCLGVDSTEINRIWPQKNFSELSDNLIIIG